MGADGEWGARAGGPGGGVDHHSLANRRDEAYRSGDLERTAELSREPNVHLGPQMFAELPGEQDSLDPRRGPSSGSARVSRGGCWLIVARYCRSSFRYYDSPGYRYISLGFRLLRIVPQRWALLHSYPVNHDVSNGRRQAAKAGAGTPEPSGEPPASGWTIFPGESCHARSLTSRSSNNCAPQSAHTSAGASSIVVTACRVRVLSFPPQASRRHCSQT